MVHALEEIHRVLRPAGTVIDLRPAVPNRQVEVELDGVRLFVGEVDSSATAPERIAADKAVQLTVERGLFRREHVEQFDYFMLLDGIEDFERYAENLRRSIVPDEVMSRVRDLLEDHPADNLIRIRQPMDIARYRKR